MTEGDLAAWLAWGSPSRDELVVPPEDLVDASETFVLAGGPSRTEQPVVWLDHTHETHEVLLPLSGMLTVQSGARVWPVPPRHGLWIPAGTSHSVRAGARCRFLTVYLAPTHATSLSPRPAGVVASPLLVELVTHLTSADMPDDARHHGEQLALSLLSLTGEARPLTLPTHGPARDVAHALLADPAAPQTVDQWARGAGVSTSSLARAFRQQTGLPFGRWRLHMRVAVAMARLADGAAVGAVAQEVGYTTTSAFVAVFGRATGISPGAFRDTTH